MASLQPKARPHVTTWAKHNGGYFRGAASTRYSCDECGYTISDQWPNWRELQALHTHDATLDDLWEDDGRPHTVDVNVQGGLL